MLAPARPPACLARSEQGERAYVAGEAEATATSVAAAAETATTETVALSLSRRHGGFREPISGGSGSARVDAATTTTAGYLSLLLPSPLVLQ